MFLSFKVFKTTNYANLVIHKDYPKWPKFGFWSGEIVISDYRPILAIWTKLWPIYKEYVMGIVL